MRLRYLIGLGGPSKLESDSVRRVGKVFDYLMVIAAVILLLQWHFEANGCFSSLAERVCNWGIWCYFVFQFFALFSIVSNRLRYLQQNWFFLFVIVVGVPQLLNHQQLIDVFYHDLRPFLALALLAPWYGMIKHSLTDDKLSTTLITVFFTVIVVGFLISGIDSGIKNPLQGIWWAWVTMSTVGYGDYVPLDLGGRIFASVVILMGLCFFAVMTANFSSLFVRRHVRRFRSKESHEMAKLQKRFSALEQRCESMEASLQRIEKVLTELNSKEKGL